MSEYSGPDQQSYAPQTTTKGATPSALDMSQVAFSAAPNYQGTPTEYYDKNGQLIGYLANGNNVMSASGLNFVNPDGTPNTGALNKHSLIQATDENGNLLYNPAAQTQAGEAPVYSTQDQGAGPVVQQLAGQIKMNAPSPSLLQDPLFRNFALSAAAMGGAAALAPALGGAAGAQAIPIEMGAAIPATDLGALPAAGNLGSLTAGLTPEAIAATEAAYPAAGAGADALVNGALPSAGITAAEALQYAKMGLSGAGLLSQLAGLGGGQGSGSGGQGGSGNTTNVSYSANGPWNTPISGQNLTWAKQNEAPVSAGDEKLKMLYPSLDPSLANQMSVNGLMPSNLAGNFFQYGTQPNFAENQSTVKFKDGGGVLQSFKEGGSPHVPEFITGTTGHYVKGKGTGQSDEIPAMLADGEFVWDADTVAQLGDGSSDAGAKLLDEFRKSVRSHKRSAPSDKIPPKASPLQYMKEALHKTGRK